MEPFEVVSVRYESYKYWQTHINIKQMKNSGSNFHASALKIYTKLNIIKKNNQDL